MSRSIKESLQVIEDFYENYKGVKCFAQALRYALDVIDSEWDQGQHTDKIQSILNGEVQP